jgi:hypothetical protein
MTALILSTALSGHLVNAADNGAGSPIPQLPSFGFDNNLPSRFDAATEVRYRVPGDGGTAVELFDIYGERVVLLVDEAQTSGGYSVVWDGKDLRGAPLSSGVYFIRLTSGDYSEIRKIIVIR